MTQLKVTEGDIQRLVKEYLQWHGFYVVKIHQSLGSVKGIADLYAIKAGRSVWIEVKSQRGVLSEYQKEFKAQIEAHGGEYWVVRCLEDIQQNLKESKNGA